MEGNDNILKKIGRNDGTTVPEGYFEDFASRMMATLPEREEIVESPAEKRTLWMRVRPYVYMAAMFAGVWTMMKMFDLMRPADATNLSIDSNPVLTAAISDDAFMNDYYLETFDDYELMQEMIDEGTVENFDLSGIE